MALIVRQVVRVDCDVCHHTWTLKELDEVPNECPACRDGQGLYYRGEFVRCSYKNGRPIPTRGE